MAPGAKILGRLTFWYPGLRLNPLFLLASAFALAFFIGACGGSENAPTAILVPSVTGGQSPLSVSFTNDSTNAREYEWNFGDGTGAATGNTEPVTHQYTKAGSYTVTLTAIGEGDPPPVSSAMVEVKVEPGELSTVTIEPAMASMAVTEEQTFTATALDQYDNPIPGLNYVFSSNRQAGRIDNAGRFIAGSRTGTYNGAITVAVIQGSVSRIATATVTTRPGPLDSVLLDPTSPAVAVDQEHRFVATGLDQYDNPIPGLTFNFDVNQQAGFIDEGGRFIAGTDAGVYDGAVTVDAIQGPFSRQATTQVTILPGPLDRVDVDSTAPSVEVTGEMLFVATARDQYNNPIPSLSFDFQADRGAGRIDSEGKFTAGTKVGTFLDAVTVQVPQGPITKVTKADATIKPGPLHSVLIQSDNVSVGVTERHSFNPRALDEYGNPVPDLVFSFEADQRAGHIDDAGVFTAGSRTGRYENSVSAQVTQGLVTRSAMATTNILAGPLDMVMIEPARPTVAVTKGQQFTAAAFDRYGNLIPDLSYSFRSDERVGHVDSTGNYVAGTTAGSFENAVTVEVTQGEVTATAVATVVLEHGPLHTARVNPDALTLDIGQSQELTAEAADIYGNPIPEAETFWEVLPVAGTIVGDGVVTAGTNTGTYGDAVRLIAVLGQDSIQATASVTVTPGILHALSIDLVTEVAAGATRQLEAVATDEYGNPVPDVVVTWEMVDSDAGSITPTGLLTAGEVAGLYDSAVNASVVQGGYVTGDSVTIVVSPGALEQLVIAPNQVNIGMEQTQQFVAVGADVYGNRIQGLDFTWSVETGGGTVNSEGLFTAGTLPATYDNTVKASATQGDITRPVQASVTVEPDRIAFISDRLDNQFDIYIMDVDGGDVRRLTDNVGFSPTWSPDGRRLAYYFCFVDERFCLTALINDDRSWRYLVSEEDADSPSWSPDGSKIAFTSYRDGNRELYVMDVDGGNATRLTDTTAAEFDPTWSPDGTRIAFVTRRDGNSEIYLMNSDGSSQTRLTNNEAADTLPAWSPDRSQILFSSDRDGDFEIYLMDADGTNVRQLTSNPLFDGNTSWSSDGTQILFNSRRDGTEDVEEASEIYVMNSDGTEVRRLTTNQDIDGSPRWAPRKKGVAVSEASVVIPNAGTLPTFTAQEVTSQTRDAVVRIVTDLGSGSGFIIDADGLVLTSNHVITDAAQITVFLDDGSSYSATVHGRDLVRDLAVLKIDVGGLPTLDLGDLSRLPLGSDVLVVGYPFSSTDLTVTRGLASAFKSDSGRNIIWMQTDSAVNPGNSGGPLLDLRGNVAGIFTAKFVGVDIEGVGLAISSNTISLYLERLIAGDRIDS